MNELTTPWTLVLAAMLTASSSAGQTGPGDQILDGIGETALIARYRFDGNVQDASRNAYHAVLHGAAGYVEDERFGPVLALPGGADGAYVQLPGRALADVDTLSVVGWIRVDDDAPWQRFFDLGRDPARHFFCTPAGPARADGCRARITVDGWTGEQGPTTFRVAPRTWVHLGVVLDPARRTLSLYVDGVRVARSTDVAVSLADVLDRDDPSANQLYLGKSRYDDPALGGRLHDVRFYGVALDDRQVAAIHRGAAGGAAAAGTTPPAEPPAATPGETVAWYPGLEGLAPVTVETVAGHLPRLPTHVAGVYRDGAAGPPVRVTWPAPEDTASVREPGTHVVRGAAPGTTHVPTATVTVRPGPPAASAPRLQLDPFPLGQVTLDPDAGGRATPFMKNRDKFVRGLDATDPDRFLFNFRDAFGQPQPEGVEPLGGWDSRTTRLRGHASGHYLTALAQACAGSTYDPALHARFLDKMNHVIDVLHDLSRRSGRPAEPGGPHTADPTAVPPGPGKDGYDSDLSADGIRTDYWNWGTGFISAYPPDQFIMLEQGASYGGRNDQVWAPYYTLHKILAGLMDGYEVGGNPRALEIARDMGLWVHARLQALPPETRIRMWNRYIAGEYGGMNEAMARLHQLTGDDRFLACARLFDNTAFFFGDADHAHGLARNVDTLRGRHANQHIPQVTGALETYRGTGDPAYYRVAENFWTRCIHGYSYAIGGVAGARNPNNAECFTAQPDSLFANGFAEGGQNETCATYNLLKLSRLLFRFDPDARYMDYYEQALYNHILASVAEDDAGNTYHVPLNPGARKRFGNAGMDGFTCCNGTALESHTKLQDTLYFCSPDQASLYVNLYVPSTLHWAERNLSVRQVTAFPYSGTTTLTLDGGGTFTLHLRIPGWATRGVDVRINGEAQAVEAAPGSYLALARDWQAGDTVTLRMPFGFRLHSVMDQPNIAAVFYGPVLLAAEEPEPRSTHRRLALDPRDPGASISGDPATLRFTAGGTALQPFFETYGRHSVYFDVTPAPAAGEG